MLSEYKKTTNVGVGLGIVLQLLGRAMLNGGDDATVLFGTLVTIGGLALFIWGCGQYAKGKGHSAWFGLFGILSIIGLLVLFFLPDRHKAAKA